MTRALMILTFFTMLSACVLFIAVTLASIVESIAVILGG